MAVPVLSGNIHELTDSSTPIRKSLLISRKDLIQGVIRLVFQQSKDGILSVALGETLPCNLGWLLVHYLKLTSTEHQISPNWLTCSSAYEIWLIKSKYHHERNGTMLGVKVYPIEPSDHVVSETTEVVEQ